ncbi:ABC transporter ATP-binding protein [Natronoglomus mannanivorans]
MSDSSLHSAGSVSKPDTIFEVENVSVSFDMDRGHSRVVDDVSVEIERDEIIGVVGESGSGKSMFAAALLDAVIEPGILSGEITYYTEDGEAIDVLNLDDDELRRFRWEEVAMVDQGAMDSFNPTMSIEEHFRETILAHEANLKESMNHARELLAELYLDPDRVFEAYPHELSGGMQQRTLIALSMVLKPNVIVMDEPTAALDLLMQRSITSLVSQLRDKYGITIIFITHDLPLVAGLADRLGVMYAFDFVEFGPTYDVLKDASHPYTRALLKAVPNTLTPLEDMRPIDGDSPDPVNVPQGCSYHPRCPLADQECIDSDPSFYEVHGDQNRLSACHHWEDAAEAIPYSLSTEERL